MRTARTDGHTTGQGKRDGGYTLIEILVTVAIFAVLAAAIQGVLLVGESSWQTNSVRVELVQEIRKAMSSMEDELRQTGPSAIDAGPVSADGETYTSIKFQKAIGVENGRIKWNENEDGDAVYTQFALDGTDDGQLLRNVIVNGSIVSATILAQNIQTLEFSRQADAPDIMEVTLEAQKNTIKGRTITVGFGFEIQMRN